ncbi:MAG: transcriptional regulator [Hyphococcus sp.]|nr:MAG: transcriptional regulator [Marinicaulis sp.]
MSTVHHHPTDETLGSFAAGRLDEARAVVIATHAALCADCARAISDFEAIGGQCLEEVEPVAMADDALEKILARAGNAASVVLRQTPDAPGPEVKLPLSAYLKGSIDDVEWKRVAPGLSQSVIEAQGYRQGVLRLLKIDPGTEMPKHSHKGNELTLILRGAYEDEIGDFGVGDLADLDGEYTHTPKAIGDEPCICLIATEAPLKFKTLVGRIAQPFIGL